MRSPIWLVNNTEPVLLCHRRDQFSTLTSLHRADSTYQDHIHIMRNNLRIKPLTPPMVRVHHPRRVINTRVPCHHIKALRLLRLTARHTAMCHRIKPQCPLIASIQGTARLLDTINNHQPNLPTPEAQFLDSRISTPQCPIRWLDNGLPCQPQSQPRPLRLGGRTSMLQPPYGSHHRVARVQEP